MKKRNKQPKIRWQDLYHEMRKFEKVHDKAVGKLKIDWGWFEDIILKAVLFGIKIKPNYINRK